MKESMILATFIQKVPMFKTSHIASLMDSISPQKKALKYLKHLENKKLIESSRLPSAEKVYRLTGKGKKQFMVSWTIPPLRSIKQDHFLAITDVYLKLGCPKLFKWELREVYTHDNKVNKYCPDILTKIGKNPVIIEIQLSAISKDRWAKKWEESNVYFNYEYYKEASWQKHAKNGYVLPEIIAISNSDPENVRNGFEVEDRQLTVVKDAGQLV